MSADKDHLRRTFTATFGREPGLIAEAPGRVNLIGEHTDYNQGFVLPVAIDRTVAVAAAPNDAIQIRVHSLDFAECDEFPINGAPLARGHGWRNYVRGVVWAMRGAGHRLRGLDIEITGDIPRGAGLSSSAALELAVAGALATASGIEIEGRDLALLAQRAENEFVGVECGIMDQLASALGQAECALLIDCRSLEVEPVALPRNIAIVVVDSKVHRNLAETPYNQRRKECAEAARALGVESLRDADEHLLESRRGELPDYLYRRTRHVITENARVLAAVGALRRADPVTLGELLYQSHESLADDFEVSCAELDLLVGLARKAEGVLGARLTGAGFGGCTVNLVRREALAAFQTAVVAPYRERTGLPADMHVCQAVDGLRVSHV
jgi:galactokinase